MIDRSVIQDYQRRYALGTGTQPYPCLRVGVFVSAYRHYFGLRQHDLLLTFDRSENYRHHRCQNISHLKRGFSLCPPFRKFV